jgi:hypothetical protein
MKGDRTMKGLRAFGLIVAFCALVMLWVSGPALAQPVPVLDQNKQVWNVGIGYELDFNDVAPANTWHDPFELCRPPGPPILWKSDLSCWVASACNLLVFSGLPAGYAGLIQNGAAASPNVDPWGIGYIAGGVGGAMTFDDGGFPDWTLRPHALRGPIITVPKFGGLWALPAGTTPIAWCLTRLAIEGVPVSLGVWWAPVGALPHTDGMGPMDPGLNEGYHAITLWDINVGAGTVTITDSDDEGVLTGAAAPAIGARVVAYAFAGGHGAWTINLYPGLWGEVNYAVALRRDPGAGINQQGKVAIHALPHASRSCTKSFPVIADCAEIVTTEPGPDADCFPVFFDLVEYQGFDYGMTWPGMYSCVFTSCSDLTIGGIVWPGDGVSHAWTACQTDPIAITGWGWIYDYGMVGVVDHPEALDINIGDCQGDFNQPLCSYFAGIGGYIGDDPCEPTATKSTSWGGIKAMYK